MLLQLQLQLLLFVCCCCCCCCLVPPSLFVPILEYLAIPMPLSLSLSRSRALSPLTWLALFRSIRNDLYNTKISPEPRCMSEARREGASQPTRESKMDDGLKATIEQRASAVPLLLRESAPRRGKREAAVLSCSLAPLLFLSRASLRLLLLLLSVGVARVCARSLSRGLWLFVCCSSSCYRAHRYCCYSRYRLVPGLAFLSASPTRFVARSIHWSLERYRAHQPTISHRRVRAPLLVSLSRPPLPHPL